MSNFSRALPPHWQVPTFELAWAHNRRHHYCVVIPVLNEGERLLRLLQRMHTLQIEKQADVLIIDGGSNDGSLEPARLQALGVNLLLHKTGPGKLSAQLRCAYAFALQANYHGIITIDGNDKDDPVAIPRFLAALQQGVDFVQASRFIAGGVAINTPKIRSLAIRYLHAPLLSLASGFHWTDTTQGFRAYSSRLLADEQVGIFRDCFDHYQLLAYLSYRAPRLGYHCLELPSQRSYPKGKIPTKISTFRGNFSLLRTLIQVCRGKYNP